MAEHSTPAGDFVDHAVVGALPVNRIGIDDLTAALRAGVDDFRAMPMHLLPLMLIYVVAGLIAMRWAMGNDLLPLLFPLVSGFALVGPIAAVALYELSKRREANGHISWVDAPTRFREAAGVLKSPAIGTIALLSMMLLVLLGLWLWSASMLYAALFDIAEPASLSGFVNDVVATPEGWKLIVYGNAIGFGFAVVVLAGSAVSFPLALDRHVGFGVAVATSVAVFRKNPVTMLAWGAVVAGLLVLGALPMLVGLALVLPVLGHATWHLYRRAVPRAAV